jgi:signal transduction histidine kinase
MPGMDGFEVCRRIKSHLTHASVPVILLSDLDDSATRLEGFKAGAIDFIGKPFVMQEVLSRIALRLALWQSRRELQQQLEQTRTLNRQLMDAQFQLLQSEKLASIGQLAAGVAHELNNPIGFVHSNLGTLDGYLHDLMEIIGAYAEIAASPGVTAQQRQTMARLLEERDFTYLKGDIFNLVTESKDGLDRVRKIVVNLKSFSRVGEQEWQDADLHQGIESTLSIVWNELKYKCKVVKDFGDIPPVFCLISQINQVILNLLVNASHAIERDGTITIRTRCHDEATVSVEIVDTGCGIAPELLGRIFEPFFTTKPVGKGTGLGLSLSYGIVQRHKGRIEVDSQPGVGSTFRLLLPIHGTPDHTAA